MRRMNQNYIEFLKNDKTQAPPPLSFQHPPHMSLKTALSRIFTASRRER